MEGGGAEQALDEVSDTGSASGREVKKAKRQFNFKMYIMHTPYHISEQCVLSRPKECTQLDVIMPKTQIKTDVCLCF